MENIETVETQQPIQPEPAVSFPSPRPTRDQGGFPKWIFAVIGLVIILAGGGFFLYQSSSSPVVSSPTPTPYVSGLDTLPTPTETPKPSATATAAPSATPDASAKSTVTIEVQNGTGTTGDAALAKSLLTKGGYTKVNTGNASSQTATETSVIYSTDVPLAVVNELTTLLQASFSPVKSKSGSGKMTVTVITGPKGTATSSPKASATPTASAKPTATP